MTESSMGTLFIVATPIGNLGDITFRAIETLQSVDVVLCEDTRITKKLLNHFNIAVATMSYHQHSTEQKVQEIEQLLQTGKRIALVTDAGTPGISDPGNVLIHELYAKNIACTIIPIPGVSAVTTALSISGFPTDKFIFLGFPPHKNKRNKFFEEVASSQYTVCFYESNHRIKKALDQLSTVLAPGRELCVCRELTKAFESVYRGTMEDIKKQTIPEKGEFVIIVRGG